MATRKQRNKKGGAPAAPSPESVKKEKEKARVLRDSVWWQNLLAKGECNYCGQTFAKKDLTMDHIVPLSRGGKSTKGNVVVACQPCNSDKKYYTAAELILKNRMDSKINF
ncbi:MAG: HNH endonuclease [Nitrospinae bacterium]|nr:HNH endonuclease [Nitrospinota bacterium]